MDNISHQKAKRKSPKKRKMVLLRADLDCVSAWA